MNRYLYAFLCISLGFILPTAVLAQAPVANFSSNVTSGCSPIVANFTDLSTNTPTSWYWDLGNGTTTTLRNPSTTYITPGTYTVTLTATNASGSNTKTVTSYITVAASPVVSFTADSTPSCTLPRTITFTNTSVAGGSGTTSYFWDFGDGTTSTAANPTKTYTSTGNYTVTLLVTNGNNCSKSLSKTNYIRIGAKPISGFSGSNRFGCTPPLTSSFTSTSIGAVSYYWNFGDGGTSTAANPTHTYTTTGDFRVYHVAISSLGCTDTIGQNAFVSIGRPNAAYTAPTSVCIGQPFTITNTSTPALLTNQWNFGDATTSTVTSPTKTYTTAGTYNVRLIVSNGTCADTEIKTIVVNPRPVAAFTASPVLGCITPFTTTFTNASTGGSTYAWTFGDATTSTTASPAKTYTAFGDYSVRLIATSAAGCKDTLTRTNYISIEAPVATLTKAPYSGCLPATVNFAGAVNTAIPVSNYSWNFGDGSAVVSCASCSTQSHTYTTAGNFTVTMTYTTGTGCVYTKTTTVSTGTKPTAGFTASPTTICPERPVTFSNSSTGATSYFWSFGDGGTSAATNPVYIGYEYGLYSVRLIADNNNCADTFTRTNYITVHPPDADFNVTYSCTNRQLVTVTDATVGGSTYYWNWGDGATSTQVGGTLTHTYAAAGTYTITLGVYNSTFGCTDTMRRMISVQPLDANFAANDTTICKLTPVSFGAVASPIITSYNWSFGNGITTTTSGNTVSDFYPTGGIYTVRLIVTDGNGCKDTMTRTNYMKVGGPAASFTGSPTTGCVPLTVNFTDNSTAPGGFGIANRLWTYGAGAPVSTSAATVSNIYNAAGTYTVKLIVTDGNGCKDSLTRASYITASKPVPQFSTNDTNVCVGQVITINNASTGNSISSVFHWGDNTVSTTNTHTYSNSGNYTIKLVVTDSYGCKDSLIKTARITVSKPTVAFTLSDTVANCPPLAVTVTNTSTGVSSYNWTFSNGSYSSLANPSTLYTYPGVYGVKLVGTSSAGCKDSLTKTVRVNGPTGTFSYSPTNGCNPLTVTFTATSNNASAYVWDMNNGYTQSTGITGYSYTYTQSGKYVPKLILSDGASCLVPIVGIDTIKVDRLDADFTYTASSLCGTGTLAFRDTVLATLSNVSGRSWSFGDGGTSTIHNPTHTYTTPGTYSIRLIVTNAQGCSDTIIKPVTIHALPSVTATANSAAICQGSTTPITLTAAGAATYTWTPATGLSCSTCVSPTVLPLATSTFIVTGVDTNGCQDTGVVTVTLRSRPTVTASGTATICNGSSTTLGATGATTYVWTPATSLSCSTCVAPIANPTSTTTYIVTGTDTYGCTDTGVVTVTVSNLPTVSAGSNVAICTGSSTTLTATGASSYTWTPSTGLSCTTCTSPVASPTVTTTYTVTGVGAVGSCSNTATVTVTVNARPTVSAGTNVAICNGSSTTLTASGATSYTWIPSTGLSCTTCASPTANPTTTTTYTVTGMDGNGCTNTSTVTVTVNPLPNVSAGSNVTICNGASTTLTATGATSYVWTPTTNLSCSTCASPIANPTTTTTYTVTGTDANSCVDTGVVTVTVNSLPSVSAGSNVTICNGSPTTLNATGATSYTWTPSTGLSCTTCANPVASPTSTTTYTVTGIGGSGSCPNTATVTVTVNPKPTVGAGSNTAICIGASTTLTASGATSYVWSPATTLSCSTCVSPIATPTATTTYTVTGTDANNCVNTASVTVTVNNKPNVTATGNNTICSGHTTTLTGNGAVSYTWTPTTTLSCGTCTSPVASPTTATTYIVTGTDANGCTDTGMITVNVNARPNVSAGSNTAICTGSSTTLTATGATSYVWSPATGLSCTSCISPIANPTTTTTYTVIGTAANGCTDTAQVQVTVNPLPAISGGPNASICEGKSTILVGSGGSSYTWSPSGTLSCTNCSTPTATPATTTTYTVTGKDGNGCENTATVTVTVNPIPNVTARGATTICNGESTQLTASGATTYQWTPIVGLSCNTCPNPIATPLGTITYYVVGSNNGCTDTTTVTVTVRPIPNITAGPDKTICEGTSDTLKASGGVSYSWSPAGTVSCSTCATTVATPTGTTVYTVTGTDGDGCKATANVRLTVNPSPNIDAGADQTLCNGSSIKLNATGGVSYSWTPGTNLTCTNCPDPTANPTSTITYTVVGSDAIGCSDSDRITITVIDQGIVTVGPDDSICIGESTTLYANGASSYEWTPAEGLSDPKSQNPTATPQVTTTYKLTAKQGDCFTDVKEVTVVVHKLPNVDLGPDQNITGGTTIELIAKGDEDIIKYEWSPVALVSCNDCKVVSTTPTRTTSYTVTVTNQYGCQNNDNMTVFVTCDNTQVFVPNTFTPNGDGVNDTFFPQGKGLSSVKSFKVYNRWGEVMFSRENMPLNKPEIGWDGTYKMAPLKPDVFVYIINAVCESGQPIEMKGDISLVR